MLLLPLCAALAEATDGEAEYYGTIGKKMTVYRDANEDSAQLSKIEAGTVVDVYKKGRDMDAALAMRADRAMCLRSLWRWCSARTRLTARCPAQAGMSR